MYWNDSKSKVMKKKNLSELLGGDSGPSKLKQGGGQPMRIPIGPGASKSPSNALQGRYHSNN